MEEGTDNHAWNKQYDDLLRTWRKQCSIQMWLHNASYYYYSNVHNWFTYPSIILSTITSIGIFSMSNNCTGSSIQSYIMGSFAMISGILASIDKHIGAAEKSCDYRLRAHEYQALIRELDYVLALSYKDRSSVVEVITEFRAEISKITDLQLDPPRKVINDYNKTHKNLEFSLFEDLNSEVLIRKEGFSDKAFVRDIMQRRSNKESVAVSSDPSFDVATTSKSTPF